MNRNETKQIRIGNVPVGGGAPIPVQSMCITRPSDAKATIDQIKRLYDAGCEIIRVAVPDKDAAAVHHRVFEQIIHAFSPLCFIHVSIRNTPSSR